ncbi:MAG: damage-control phosphatase ARMT1 family protein [Spirochaetia bacterium]
MKTYLECYPCFFRQAVEAAQFAGLNDEDTRQVLIEIGRKLEGFSLETKPPEMAVTIHKLIKEKSGNSDPYRQQKQESTRLALNILPDIRKKLLEADDHLLMAVQLAVAGNIIDFGVKQTQSFEQEIFNLIHMEERLIEEEEDRFFQFEQFKEALFDASSIIYLGDNAGETVFDRILLEEIKSVNPEAELVYTVRGTPIINDAVLEDARQADIQKSAEIITSGSDGPGTLLHRCSDDFLARLNRADLIISKGQGNFESLSESDYPVFYLLIAKCPVVARHVGCRKGDFLLLDNKTLESKNA